MNNTKHKIRRAAAERRRSSFREEFYKDNPDRKRQTTRRQGGDAGARVGRVPLWVSAGGLGLLFCVIAVGGSSAIIWLRKLGAIFGVHWIGD